MATTFTGKGIDVFRLQVAKSAIELESKGLRMSRGRQWSTVMRIEFGLKRNAPHAVIIAAIDAKLAELVPQAIEEGGIRS